MCAVFQGDLETQFDVIAVELKRRVREVYVVGQIEVDIGTLDEIDAEAYVDRPVEYDLDRRVDVEVEAGDAKDEVAQPDGLTAGYGEIPLMIPVGEVWGFQVGKVVKVGHRSAQRICQQAGDVLRRRIDVVGDAVLQRAVQRVAEILDEQDVGHLVADEREVDAEHVARQVVAEQFEVEVECVETEQDVVERIIVLRIRRDVVLDSGEVGKSDGRGAFNCYSRRIIDQFALGTEIADIIVRPFAAVEHRQDDVGVVFGDLGSFEILEFHFIDQLLVDAVTEIQPRQLERRVDQRIAVLDEDGPRADRGAEDQPHAGLVATFCFVGLPFALDMQVGGDAAVVEQISHGGIG